MPTALKSAVPSLELEDGLSPQETSRRICVAIRRGDIEARAQAFYLANMADHRLYVDLGYSSFKAYSEGLLPIAESTAREYVSVGRALRDLPAIDEAFAADLLAWTQVKVLSRIATPETEQAWVDWAATRSLKLLRRQSDRRKKGDLPTRPERETMCTPLVGVSAMLSPTEHLLYRRGREKVEGMLGRPVSDKELLLGYASLMLRQRPDGTLKGWTPVKDDHYVVQAVADPDTGDLVHVGEDGERLTLNGAELSRPRLLAEALLGGFSQVVVPAGDKAAVTAVESSATEGTAVADPFPVEEACAAEPAATDRESQGERSDHGASTKLVATDRESQGERGDDGARTKWVASGRESRGERTDDGAGEKREVREAVSALRSTRRWDEQVPAITSTPSTLLDPLNSGESVPPELRANATPKTLRERVLRRDGYRCRCCGARRTLTVHHVWWRRFGGPTHAANLITLCKGCHSLVHANYLFLIGEVPDRVTFLDRQGRPIHSRMTRRPVELSISKGPSRPAQLGGDLVEFRNLPAEVDVGWWSRHRHLFRANEGQGELVFRAGYPREPIKASRSKPDSRIRPGVSRSPEGSIDLESDAEGGADVRPPTPFAELCGQARLRKLLAVAAQAAKQRGEPLRPLLLTGAPGLGKTHLAAALAAELGAVCVRLMAPAVRTPREMLRALTSLEPGAVLFLDEVHGLPQRVSESLYDAMDRGALTVNVRQGAQQKALRIRLDPFTLVAATTDENLLPKPLLSRFVCERLEFYSRQELGQILERAAGEKGLSLEPAASMVLAAASRDTPRQALQLLCAVRDEAAVLGVSVVNRPVVERALLRLGVDGEGLSVLDRAYLSLLRDAQRPLSLKALAAGLGATEAVVEHIVEPFLLRRGLIRISSQGRSLAGRHGGGDTRRQSA